MESYHNFIAINKDFLGLFLKTKTLKNKPQTNKKLKKPNLKTIKTIKKCKFSASSAVFRFRSEVLKENKKPFWYQRFSKQFASLPTVLFLFGKLRFEVL